MSFDLQEYLKKDAERRAVLAEKVKSDAGLLMDKLAEAGVELVEIEFDGQGDEGSINTVSFDGDSEYDISSHALSQEVQDWADELLESTGVDWYNSEGGCGEIHIKVTERKYDFVVNQRYEKYKEAAAGEETV